MHSALPIYHPQKPAKRPPILRRLRPHSALRLMKQITIALAFVLLIVKFFIVPYRVSQAQQAFAATVRVSDYRAPGSTLSSTISSAPTAAGKDHQADHQVDQSGWGPDVSYYDLSKQTRSTHNAALKNERVLICMPLRNAEPVLVEMMSHLNNLTYPHELIDLAFLVSDSTDNTFDKLSELVELSQTGKLNLFELNAPFNKVDIYKHDFGATVGQGFDDRHGVHVQAERRKLMGRARNWLLSTALQPEHSWVYWRDADIEFSEPSILEDLMKFDQDVLVPNVWRPLPSWLGGQQPYDLNAWQESDAALQLANELDEDDVIVEGYAEYATWRVHLAYLRDPDGNGDLREMIPLDGIGGVSILVRANVHRAGSNFPGFAFLSHAETEGFGKMSKRMGYSVAGLTQYTVWHKYEPSEEDLIKMKEMEAQGLPID